MEKCCSIQFVLFLAVLVASAATDDTGLFWHVTDMHWDPTYNTSSPGVSCGFGPQPSYGSFGSYFCDSPWSLINSSVYAMRKIQGIVDFIIWTGDDTPHSATLTKDEVATIVFNLTSKIQEVFPTTIVFPVLGNHDWSPKHQLPPQPDSLYDHVADIWKNWLTDPVANQTFRICGYYRTNISQKLVLIGLNTNLYSTSDTIVTQDDPGNQFQWLDNQLTDVANKSQKAILIGHIPPGRYERSTNSFSYKPNYNQNFTALLRKHHAVLGSVHLAHQHMDTFRMVYDDRGNAISSFFIAPAITPWTSTNTAGNIGTGKHNPGIRLVKYSRTDGTILDVYQYYLNVTKANIDQNFKWELEYQGTIWYKQPDMTTASLNKIAKGMWTDDALFTKYYSANNVMYNPGDSWSSDARLYQFCAITQLDYTNYTNCLQENNGTATVTPPIGASPSLFQREAVKMLIIIFVIFNFIF